MGQQHSQFLAAERLYMHRTVQSHPDHLSDAARVTGRTEFAMSLFGRSWGRKITGRAMLRGREVDLSTVSRAIDAGLAYVTEDRKQLGLLLADDVRKNITLANLDSVAVGRVIDDIRELQVASDYRDRMRIRCSDVYQTSGDLSGGNQQKVVLSKWLFTDPEILILDEPTRGIDIGAKYEIYCVINELADSGKAVVVISSEMPELLGVCDVMNAGVFVAEFERAEATPEKIMRVIMRKGERLVDRDLERKLEEKLLGEARR
jgi:putative multiple sugar transport system ATP-binding protein